MSVVEKPWLVSSSKVLAEFHVKPDNGLSEQQVHEHRQKYGPNTIPSSDGTSLFVLILKQFEDLLVLILLGAAFISFVLACFEDSDDRLTAFVEPAVILIILICNATVGVLQETKAESAIEKLKESEASEATVIRDGKKDTIDAIDLVPGDILILQEGDRVPADARIIDIQTNTLLMEEPALTGESEPVSKTTSVIDAENIPNGDKKNLIFSGSLCVKGRALAVIYATGLHTELGRIAKDLDKSNDDDDDDNNKTPLQLKLDEFGEQLSKYISVICILVWLINLGHFTDPVHGSVIRGAIYYFKIAVSLAVAAIPEGLPAVVTTCLAIGAQAMAKNGAIVRNLPSVETLGCCTVICSDKTGTLTTGMMSVQEIVIVTDTNTEYATPEDLDAAANTTTSSSNTTSTGKQRRSSSRSRQQAASLPGHLHTYTVLGNSYSPYGQVVEAANTDIEVTYPSVDSHSLNMIARISALCSDSFLTVHVKDHQPTNTDTSTEQVIYGKSGASTEAALLVLAEKLGTDKDDTIAPLHDDDEQHNNNDSNDDAKPVTMSMVDEIRLSLPIHKQVSYVRDYWLDRSTVEHTLEFTRDRKSMSVVVYDTITHDHTLLCKGAAEGVLDRCSMIYIDGKEYELTSALRQQLENRIISLNRKGLRSLALAYKSDPPQKTSKLYNDDNQYVTIEDNMTFVGFVGMLDPPRESVPQAISDCRQAGIRVIMITGDNKFTAEAIGQRIGLILPSEYNNMDILSYSGQDIDKMDNDTFNNVVSKALIFSRVEHHHKLKIVNALKSQGNIVAMTGDGVNDATALSTADIGIAMGSGTSVAKEASKMVLNDDDFSTIVMSVAQGRTIYNNTKQFIRYLISSNIGEVACIFGTAALGLPDALIPVQLLWVNLVTDGLPATALGLNPPDKDVMNTKPRSSSEPIIDLWLFIRYVIIGLYVGIGTIAGYVWWYLYAPNGPQISYYTLTHFHQCTTAQMGSDTYSIFAPVIDLVRSGQVAGLSQVANASASQQEICEALFENYIPSSISLSILVTIEMFNALNAVSENQSIFIVTPFSNIYVIFAVILSFILHFMILYIPWLANIFKVAPLDYSEWYIVLILSLPVVFIDEILKFVSRLRTRKLSPSYTSNHRKIATTTTDSSSTQIKHKVD